MSWRLLVLALSCLAIGAGGCQATGEVKEKTRNDQAAVVIDFYKGDNRSAACSGTLISQNLVLTAAHCADGTTSARVSAPNANGARVSVSRILTYDWSARDAKMDRAKRNDLALLLLREPINLTSYPKIQQRGCMGCNVVQVGRNGQNEVVRIPTRLSEQRPAGRPVSMFARDNVPDSGGAVFRLTPGGEASIVGVTMGRGTTTNGGYVAQLSDPAVQNWIRAVARSASRSSNFGSGPNAKPLDDESGGDSYDPGFEDTTGGDYNDPIDYGSGSTGDDPGNPSDPSDPGDPTDPGNPSDPGDPSDPGNPSDPGDPSDPGYPSDPGDPSDPGYPQEDPLGNPDSEYDPTGSSSDQNNSGNESPSSDPGEKVDAPTTPENVEETGKVDESADSTKSGGETPPATDSTPPQSYSPNNIVYTPNDSTGEWVGSNAYVAQTPADKANGVFSTDADYAKVLNEQGANLFSSHGTPGGLQAPYDPAVAEQLMANDKPVIMGTCFAGAPSPNGTDEGADSVASKFAQDGGGNPANVYGCTGYAVGAVNGMGCGDTWVDGNGQPLSDEIKQKYNLQTCQTSYNQSGNPIVSGCTL